MTDTPTKTSSAPTLAEQLSHLGPPIETHSAWVFLGPRFVLKTKKPLNLGFLDFSTLGKRKEMCDAEVRLNHRLAPNVYLAVVPILMKEGVTFVDDLEIDSQRPRASEGAQLVDHGIKMRRLADQDRADVLSQTHQLTPAMIVSLAERLAHFHQNCATSLAIDQFGAVEVIERNVQENFEQAQHIQSECFGGLPISELAKLQNEFLKDHLELFALRVKKGFVRDGHGDLRLEHVYFEKDEIIIVDCIEFSDRFRYADVASDLAFLSMDLRLRAGDILAERLLAEYAWVTRDFGLFALIDFYESYRAFVRAKVTALRSTQSHHEQPQELIREVERYCSQAANAMRPTRPHPRLICVGGLIASGKSTVCSRLRQSTCPIVIDSDHTRKYLHGLQANTPHHVAAFEGLYHPAQSEAVYSQMADDARVVLSSQRSVIVEASFSRRHERTRFLALAEELGAEAYFIECRVPREVAHERLKQRKTSVTVSDGRLEIYDSVSQNSESIDADEFERFLVLNTDEPQVAQSAALRSFFQH